MDRGDWSDRLEGQPEMGRVRPRMAGRSLPVPPVLPVVAAIALLVGLSLGFSLGSMTDRFSLPAPTEPPAPTFEPTATPATTVLAIAVQTPPSGGLSLSQAMAALRAAGYNPGESLLSARVIPGQAVVAGAVAPEWVWSLTWQATCSPFGNVPQPASGATYATTMTMWSCLAEGAIDYETGQFVSASQPVGDW